MAWHLQALRRHQRGSAEDAEAARSEFAARHARFRISRLSIGFSALYLGGGAVALATCLLAQI